MQPLNVPLRTYRRALYSYVVNEGFWLYDGEFGPLQLVSPPADAPKWDTLYGENPIVLEFQAEVNNDYPDDQRRLAERFFDTSLVLSALVAGLRVPDRQVKSWAYVQDEPHAAAGRTQPVTVTYWTFGPASTSIPGASDDGFTDTSALSPLPTLPHDEYYSRHGVGGDDWFIIPNSLADSLDRLGRLDAASRARFVRAAYWLNHAYSVWETSHSATYMAIAQCIEAMLPEGTTQWCGTCKRPHDEPSIGRRFAVWVEENVAESEGRQRLYKLRSQIGHGSSLLEFDRGTFGMDSPQQWDQHNLVMLAWRAARNGLCNWLHNQP